MVDDLGRGHYEVDVDNDAGVGKIRSTEAALTKAGDTAEETGRRSSSAFSKFGDIGRGAVMGVGLAVGNLASGAVLGAVSGTLGKMGDSISLASDKAEAASKVNVLFGDSAGIVAKASENAATAMGLSSGAYLTAAGNLGNLTTNLGFTGDEAANMSVDMLALAADMGSFNNASTEEVTEAMGAAFRGESEPIRRFGVMLDEAAIKEKALEMGLYSGTGAIDRNAKAQATYALILEQTTAAQGDFARTSDGLANSQRIAAAKQEEAWTRLGEKLMPIVQAVLPVLTEAIIGLVDGISGVVDSIGEWVAANQPLVDMLSFLADNALKGIGLWLGIFIDAIGQVAGMLGGFIGLVIDVLGAIVDLGAAIVKVFSGDFEGAAASAESAMGRIASAGDNMPPAPAADV